MYIKSIGVNYRHNAGFVKNCPNGTDEYILLLIKSNALFKLNGKYVKAEPNSVIVYKKHSQQYFCADGEMFANDWICFDIEDCETDFFKEIGISFDTLYKLENAVAIADHIQTIHYEYITNELYMKEKIDVYLKFTFYKIAELIKDTNSKYNKYTVALREIRNEIFLNPTKRRTVKELAYRLHISTSYFSHLYKSEFGSSPIADEVSSRMNYAKQLLLYTDNSIKNVAYELNYSDPIQFIQQFKSVTKQTPLQYRKCSK